MATMNVEVVSAERQLFSGEATEVFARSLDGEIGILPGHQPALLALDIAPVKIKMVGGGEEIFAVHNGFLYFGDNRLVILADTAERASEIDVRRAETSKRELEARAGDAEDTATASAIRRATVRIAVGN